MRFISCILPCLAMAVLAEPIPQFTGITSTAVVGAVSNDSILGNYYN